MTTTFTNNTTATAQKELETIYNRIEARLKAVGYPCNLVWNESYTAFYCILDYSLNARLSGNEVVVSYPVSSAVYGENLADLKEYI